MRAATVTLLLSVLLAGCTGGEVDGSRTTTPTGTTQIDDDGIFCDPCGDLAPLAVEAPRHPVGRAWTFEGDEIYNEDHAFTVVVASNASGHEFAAGAPDDLVYHALWFSPWYGKRDAHMNGIDGYRALDFPLTDGKSWMYDAEIRVTARAVEDAASPNGPTRGFRIEGASERWRVSYDYAIEAGQITRFEQGRVDGPVIDAVRMTGVTDVREWVWFERGDVTVVPTPQSPQAFAVPDGYDNVIASAGGRDGSRAIVAPPQGEAWTSEFAGEESWHHAMLPATPGQWSAEVVGYPYVEGAPDAPADAPIGWAYMHVAPVKWVKGAA